MVKVYALKDNVKKDVTYPIGKIGFNEEGEADWPLDQFTHRRIRDGDISLEPPAKQAAERKAVPKPPPAGPAGELGPPGVPDKAVPKPPST